MRAYRIVRPAFAATALSGEGARLYGGRWNIEGLPCVYTAGSRALAALELLVHAAPEALGIRFQLIEIEIPDELLETRLHHPPGWEQMPAGDPSKCYGDRWLRGSYRAALRVPSAVIPEEWNFLLNPRHPDFRKVKQISEKEFRFDPRMSLTT
jgi:RES domain-containing protein